MAVHSFIYLFIIYVYTLEGKVCLYCGSHLPSTEHTVFVKKLNQLARLFLVLVLTRATWTVNSTPMPTEATRITTGMALSLMPRKPMMPKSPQSSSPGPVPGEGRKFE